MNNKIQERFNTLLSHKAGANETVPTLTPALARQLLERLDQLVAKRRSVTRGDALFRTGDAFLIPDGFRGYWEVIETTTKHFVIRSYTPG